MSHLIRRCSRLAFVPIVLAFLALSLFALSACAQAGEESLALDGPRAAQTCVDGDQSTGARYRVCMPSFPMPWNGDLLVYAHGYMDPGRPIEIPEEQLEIGGVSLPGTLTSLGYAFATTSYSTNGLAMREAVTDLVDLVDVFSATHGAPDKVILAGPSEGGVVTVLAMEKHPDLFDGGLAACGPIGGIPAQINYMGDFRVVFDYYFSGLLPGEPISIPQTLIDNWPAYLATVVHPVISDPGSAISLTQVLAVTGAAVDPADPTSALTTTYGLLWYSVFATNDAQDKLGGQPYDNWDRAYSGSADDGALNAGVLRYRADPSALAALQESYQTTGWIRRPLVTVHTTRDEIVPYWHQPAYEWKLAATGRSALHQHVPVDRYGHCNFTANEVVGALQLLLAALENPPEVRHRVLIPLIFK
jgi:pimeloyl-ACP methyl ester carboxylesterase